MPFTPLSIANCELWLEGSTGVYHDAGVTLATAGQSVQQWNDQSGNNNHCVQAASGNRPVFNTSPNRVTFSSASSQFLNNPNLAELGGFFCVLKTSDTSGYCCWAGADTSETSDLGAYYLGTSTGDNSTAEGFASPATFKRVTDLSATTGGTLAEGGMWAPRINDAYHIVFGRINGSRLEFGMNGAILGAVNITGTPRAISAAVIGGAYFGHAVTGNFADCEILELLMYSSAPSDSELASLISYASSKYGISLYTDPPSPVTYYAVSFGGEGYDHEILKVLQAGDDGVAWKNVFASYNPGTGKYVRDPNVLYRSTTYWIAHTNDTWNGSSFTNSTTITIASSSDLHSWSVVTEVDCAAVTSTFAWSPCFLEDGADLYLFFSTNSSSLYYVQATDTAGLTTWGTPASITLSGETAGNLDAPEVILKGGIYYLWYDLVGEGIGYASSYTPTGTYTVAQSAAAVTDWANWIAQVAADQGVSAASVSIEGPTLRLLADGTTWRIWFDAYSTGAGTKFGLYYADSTDDWITWSTIARVTSVDGFILRHGAMLVNPTPAAGGLLLRRRRAAAA